MNQLETQLLSDGPLVVLIGSNSSFRFHVSEVLKKFDLNIKQCSSSEILEGKVDLNIISGAYKIIWLYENNAENLENYLDLLSVLKQVQTPVVIVANIFSSISSFSSDLFKEWLDLSNKQSRFIEDCILHLPKASFIFGQNLIVDSQENDILRFLTKNIHRNIIIDPSFNLNFLNPETFVKIVEDSLFRPGKQASVLVRGIDVHSQVVVGSIKKLYDVYHNSNIEIINDTVSIANSIPFSAKENIVDFDFNSIVAGFVKKLKAPQVELIKKEIIFKPNIPQQGRVEVKEIIFKPNVPQQSRVEVTEKQEVKLTPKPPIYESQDTNSSSLRIETTEVTEKKFFEKKYIPEVNYAQNIVKTGDQSLNEKSNIVKKSIDSVSVDDEIKRIFKSTRTETKVDRIREIAKNTKKNSKRTGRKKVLFVGGIVATGVASAVLVLAGVFFASQSFLKKELVSFVLKKSSGEDMMLESKKLKTITDFVNFQANGYSLILDTDTITSAKSMVAASNGLQSAIETLSEVNEMSKNLVLKMLTGNGNKTSEMAEILGQQSQNAYEALSDLEANLKLVNLDISSEEKEKAFGKYETELRSIKNDISVQAQLQPILSSLTGEDSKKTYAVIFQNNQELRPTGGFIQAVALLNFDGGSLVSHDVYSVYSLDQKLSGAVVPPEEVTTYLGEEKWYLRDSNWNPDFPSTSRQIEWFISKSTGVQVDGVIAVNLFTIKDLLEAIGPVDLPDYNEVINSKNILERMEFHSEVVLIDSPDSIDYSVVLLEKILEKVTKISDEKVSPLLYSLKKSISENQLAFSVSEKENQQVLHDLGWTGGLIKPSCPAELSLVDCRVDSISQVEANVGINKANYYLDRAIDQKITIDKEKAVHQRKITFKNNAKSNSWPKGTYKSFQRFFIDEDSLVEGVFINGSPLIEEQISKKIANGFLEIGISVDVPIQKTLEVEINYSTPLNFDKGFSYVFFNKKQAGTSGDPVNIVFEHSSDISPVLISPSADVVGRKIIFDTKNSNSLFSVEFE